MKYFRPSPNVNRLALLALTLVAASAQGCGNGRAAAKQTPPVKKSEQIEAKAAAHGIKVLWSEKQDDGTIHKVIEAEAQEGSLNAKDKTSELKSASGVLYKENKPRARFAAPIVKADEGKHTIVATGGVEITSIEPAGYKVTAKKATWNAAKDTITAEGEVWFTLTHPGDEKPSASIGPAPKAVFHTELKTYTIWNAN